VKANKKGRFHVALQNLEVLVAGGAGFIGSHIVDKLIDADAKVTVMDNLYTGQLENIEQHKQNKNFHFVKGDVRNLKLAKETVNSADYVINVSAVVSVPRSIEDPLLVNEVNVKGTLNLLKASVDSHVKRFIQASSASVYGDAKKLPVCEDFAPKPLSPYAVSKLASDNYAAVFHQVYGLETVCLRYFNVYGPRQVNNPYSGVITRFANDFLGNRQPKIFGDGEQTRDFVFVEDVASANLLALTKKNAAGEIFNIASGKATTINELFQILQEKMGKKGFKPVHIKSRAGDIRHSYANIEKAKTRLGYDPVFSLENGLKELVRHMVDS
jgi:nucleoside-diphosphate-sugar epimerase